MALTQDQLAIRAQRIGASEAGALLSVDPYRTSLDLYASRLHALPASDEGEDHRSWGLDMERPILAHAARRMGWTLVGSPGTLVDDRFPHLCATPDDVVDEQRFLAPCDAKNVQVFHGSEWGDPGTGDVPLQYAAQLQVQIALLQRHGGGPRGYLCATIGGSPPDVWVVEYDPEVFGVINDLATKFMVDHVIPGRPPDGWESDRHAADYIAKRFARSTEGVRQASLADIEALADYRIAQENLKSAEALEAAAKARLCARVGDAQGVDRVAKWVDVKAVVGPVTDWRMVAQDCAIKAGLSHEQAQAVADTYTTEQTTRNGYRYLLPAKPAKQKTLTASASAAALEQ